MRRVRERGDPDTGADDGDDGEKHEADHENPTGHSSLMIANICRFSKRNHVRKQRDGGVVRGNFE